MLGFLALVALVAGAAAIAMAVGVVLLVLKLVFKIVLFPIKLAGGLLFGVLSLIGVILLSVEVLLPQRPIWTEEDLEVAPGLALVGQFDGSSRLSTFRVAALSWVRSLLVGGDSRRRLTTVASTQ